MAKVRNVSKNLASMEDLLQGKGVVAQTRGKKELQVHRVDVPFALDTEAEMQALDVTRYTRARVYSDATSFVEYIYDPAATSGIAPGEGSGFWVVSFSNRDTVTLYQFGAVGDGVADDTLSVQAAFDSGKVIRQAGGRFRYTSVITVPSYTDFTGEGGATFIKDVQGNGFTQTGFPLTLMRNCTLRGFKHELFDTSIRGNVCTFLNVHVLKLIDFECVTVSDETATGAWSLYLNGNDITVHRPRINSIGSGLYGDGIHLSACQQVIISDGIIEAGDDCIAIWTPDAAWANVGTLENTLDVTVDNMVLKSSKANVIRIGYEATAPTDLYMDNISISNIIDATRIKTGPARSVIVQDKRPTRTVSNGRILLSNISNKYSTDAGNLIVTAALALPRAFNEVLLDNVKMADSGTGASGAFDSVENLVISNCRFVTTVTTQTVSTFTVANVGTLHMTDTTIGGTTTANVVALNDIYRIHLEGNRIYGNTNPFRLVNIIGRVDNATRVTILGGSMGGVTTLLGVTNALAYFVWQGTALYEYTNKIPTLVNLPADHVVAVANDALASANAQVGVGSAGAGSQAVVVKIHGVDYKLLHDGTV